MVDPLVRITETFTDNEGREVVVEEPEEMEQN